MCFPPPLKKCGAGKNMLGEPFEALQRRFGHPNVLFQTHLGSLQTSCVWRFLGSLSHQDRGTGDGQYAGLQDVTSATSLQRFRKPLLLLLIRLSRRSLVLLPPLVLSMSLVRPPR